MSASYRRVVCVAYICVVQESETDEEGGNWYFETREYHAHALHMTKGSSRLKDQPLIYSTFVFQIWSSFII